jgi:hypothetical protein
MREHHRSSTVGGDIERFSRRLDAWARDLPARERVMLRRILMRATAAGDDTAGYAETVHLYANPTPPSLSIGGLVRPALGGPVTLADGSVRF